MITPEIQGQVLASMHARYGNWTGFRDPAFLADEIDYKRKVIANAQPLVAASTLQELLNTARFGDFIAQLESAAKKSTNLLYMSTPKSGDLRILYAPALERPAFCRAIYDLLYGEGPSPARLGRYLDYIDSVKLPNYWTFPTYFLFITDPQHDVFVKPRTMHAFLDSIQASEKWIGTPSAEAYATIVAVANDLRAAMQDFGPEDMVDIQSVMYVCAEAHSKKPVSMQANPAEANTALGFPFSQIFKSYVDADAAFDLLGLAFEYLGISSPDDERFALTIPKKEDQQVLRLNFGYWATLAFYGPDSPGGYTVSIVLKEGIPGLTPQPYGFKQGPDESKVRFYHIPFEEVNRLTGSLAAEFEEAFRFISQRFAERKRCLFRGANLPSLARAVFQLDFRKTLLREGMIVPVDPPPTVGLEVVAEVTGFDLEMLGSWVGAIKRKRQAILYGPPGTGKTFLAELLAAYLVADGDGFVDLVQFHPAYAYEDFVQGIRPCQLPGGGLDYPIVPGRFLEFCQKAERRNGSCVLIIDEINRANLARVFGELMYLLEYRDRDIPLAAGGQRFRIPKNVLIIGTMNTADRSIALVDHALRRRFAFLEVRPNYGLLREYITRHNPGFPAEQLVSQLKQLNNLINDRHYEVGISFFMTENLGTTLQDIWKMEIEPYLEEYFFDQPAMATKFAWENVRTSLLL